MTNLINVKRSAPASTQRGHNPFMSLQNELDRAMDEFYSVFDAPSFSMKNFDNLLINPSIDIVDSKDNIKIEAELPGMGEEDVKVSVNEGVLTIKGEKKTSKKDEGKNYIRREIGYGSYERHIALPDSVDTDKAKATFKKGMLWVELPKKAESIKKSRELPVEKAAK